MGSWGALCQTARRKWQHGRREMAAADAESTRQRHRELQLERFEERVLLAISPQLIAVIPNQGALLNDGDTLNASLRELTFRFDEGQVIDPATVAAIRIERRPRPATWYRRRCACSAWLFRNRQSTERSRVSICRTCAGRSLPDYDRRHGR